METVFGSLQSTSFSLSNLLFNNPLQPKFTHSRVSFQSHHRRKSNPFLSSSTRECSLLFEPYRLQKSCIEAVVGDAAAVPNDCAEEQLAVPNHDRTGTREGSAAKDSESSGEDEGYGDSLDNPKMVKVCDKLIEVFMVDRPNPTDWRRLLGFSRQWNKLRPHFFQRCQTRADSENDPGQKHKLLRLARKLKEIDADVQRHNELLKVIKRRSPDEISEVVAKRRKDFTQEFFEHLCSVTLSYREDSNAYAELSKLGEMAMEAVEAYDNASQSTDALRAADLKFQDILSSPSLAAACKKIDDLAEKNQLDPALALLISKAWSATKETSVGKDEVKDIMYHLYETTKGNLQRLVPKEIRIIKYLITLEDPKMQEAGLQDAFIPGEEIEGQDIDFLYTTPKELYAKICMILEAYYSSQEGTLLREARDLMNPIVIKRLEELKKILQDKFM